MDGLITGLRAFKQREEEKKSKQSTKNNVAFKDKYLQLKDGESVEIRFLQELDEDADGFDASRGLGFVAVEHRSPIANAQKQYWIKCLCTIDSEGQCLACEKSRVGDGGERDEEQRKQDWKDWKSGEKLYINVLVNPGTENEQVRILQQGVSAKSITPSLYEYATDDNTITDKTWVLKRTGGGFNDTSYTIRPRKTDVKPFNYEGVELFDLKEEVNSIPYDKQAEYLLVSQKSVESKSSDSVEDVPAKEKIKSEELDW